LSCVWRCDWCRKEHTAREYPKKWYEIRCLEYRRDFCSAQCLANWAAGYRMRAA
jgi:hypothetical protein